MSASTIKEYEKALRHMLDNGMLLSFRCAWLESEKEGWCDGIDGMEYQRVYDEWLSAGYPLEIKEFIYQRANANCFGESAKLPAPLAEDRLMGFVYVESEEGVWTAGHYDHKGKFFPESDHKDQAAAAHRCHFLNGGNLPYRGGNPAASPTAPNVTQPAQGQSAEGAEPRMNARKERNKALGR